MAPRRPRRVSSDERPTLRYRAVPPDEQPAQKGLLRSRVDAVKVRLPRPGLSFAKRFDAAVANLLADPAADKIPPEQALQFFGTGLQLTVDPARLRWRI